MTSPYFLAITKVTFKINFDNLRVSPGKTQFIKLEVEFRGFEFFQTITNILPLEDVLSLYPDYQKSSDLDPDALCAVLSH